jgi:hypothetical protein
LLAAFALLSLTAATPLKLAAPGFHYAGVDAALLSRSVVELGKRGGFKITSKDDSSWTLDCECATQSCSVNLCECVPVDAPCTLAQTCWDSACCIADHCSGSGC